MFRSGYKGLYALGIECKRFEKWQQALLFLDEALRLNPREGGKVSFPGTENIEYLPHYHLATVLYEIGNYERALVAIEEAEGGGLGLVTLAYNRKKWHQLQQLKREMMEKSFPVQRDLVLQELAAIEAKFEETRNRLTAIDGIEVTTVGSLLTQAREDLDAALAGSDFSRLNQARTKGREAWAALLALEDEAVKVAEARKAEAARAKYDRAVTLIASGECSADAVQSLGELAVGGVPPDPDVPAIPWLRLAEAHLQCNQFEEAAQSLERAQLGGVDPEDIRGVEARLRDARDTQEFRIKYESIESRLASEDCQTETIEVLEELVGRSEMLEVARRQRAPLFLPLAEAWLRCGDLDRTSDSLERAAESGYEPPAEIARVQDAREALLKEKKEVESAAKAVALLQGIYDSAVATLVNGVCQESAIEQLIGVTRVWRDDARQRGLQGTPHLILAIAQLACGRVEDAESSLAQSQAHETASSALLEAVESTIANAKEDRASEARLASAGTDYLVARLLLGSGTCSQDAIRLLEALLPVTAKSPGSLKRFLPNGMDPSPQVDLAQAYRLCGDRERAAALVQRAETDDPQNMNNMGDLVAWLRTTEKLQQLPSYALVIGVSSYDYWPDLPAVPAEIEGVRKVLEAHGFADPVVVLDPTLEQLQKTMKRFFYDEKVNTPESRVVFYFAGHGHSDLRQDSRLAWLVPADAGLPREGETSWGAEMIAMEEFRVPARHLKAKHAAFIFDSCFSGSVFDALGSEIARSAKHVTDDMLGKDVRLFITAGEDNERVPSESSFTKALIEALEGLGDGDRDGLVLGSEIGAYVQDFGSTSRNKPQWGMMREDGFDEGDIAFSRLPVEATPKTLAPEHRAIEEETTYWRSVLQRGDPADVEAYLRNNERSAFAPVAEGLLEATRGYEVRY